MQIEYEGEAVEHRINRRLKHSYLTVEADGTVVLKSNGRNLRQLQRFVNEKAEWIARQRQKMAAREPMVLGESILYLGQILNIANVENFIFSQKDPESIRRSYHRFYKTMAEAYIPERTAFFAAKMQIGYGSIRFRRMKRRWGSCSAAGDLTFNTLLMQRAPELIDYTIVHELAHRIHFNHSHDFHALVRSVFPDETLLRRQMRAFSAMAY